MAASLPAVSGGDPVAVVAVAVLPSAPPALPVPPGSAAAVALQGAAPVAIAGTVALSALFFSVTAHVAARNVLGDVTPIKALGVGAGPAVLATLPGTFGLQPALALAAALVVDAAAFYVLYERTPRLVAYLVFVHAVVTVILGAVVFGLLALISSAPG